MDIIGHIFKTPNRRLEWRFAQKSLLVILYLTLYILQCNCQDAQINHGAITKTDNLDVKVDNNDTNHCHSCQTSNKFNNENKFNNSKSSNETDSLNYIDDIIITLSTLTKRYLLVNTTETQLEDKVEDVLNNVLSKDQYEIIEGVEIKPVDDDSKVKQQSRSDDDSEARALFSKYTYEYRMFQKIKNFIETHVLSINLPKAAKFMGFRSFGLSKFFVPLLIGGQVLFKSILLAMFLPSILGSFGKMLGKGISQLSATSSQASYPPVQGDQTGYNSDNKDFMGYETNLAGAYAYPQDDMYGNMDGNDVNDLQVDMSRYGDQKVSYLPTKNGYYQNQMGAGNNYKVFHKIPASSMILSNYDPFYSPLLSRLDGIFARLGLAPSENSIDGAMIGGQSVSDVKLESCREQLICLMYASPAKYAPYSNLVSAQLSRELNELRRPVSDNPEILRFFRYMRAARRGQEGVDCVRAHPGCSSTNTPEHTMIAAYHDINKLVSARKLKN
ncbi:uncharacterized protein Osi24 [Plodia interpunctella]|uniref:uncharacterized protein Osi24 n=1 Tax=Plodia interpunctella TaxID=58824 RepID=UPI0023684B75|nr:uncharacterized protein LOC128680527 [Plodia interpunctella]XP_053619718.1 uncharacterized protein LOC128680527 [Plodia interpunctella]